MLSGLQVPNLPCEPIPWAFLEAQMVKNLPAMQETWVQFLGWEDPPEKEMAAHSSILAWGVPWTKEPGGLQSMGLQRVGYSWATNNLTFNLSLVIWEHFFQELLSVMAWGPCPQQTNKPFGDAMGGWVLWVMQNPKELPQEGHRRGDVRSGQMSGDWVASDGKLWLFILFCF